MALRNKMESDWFLNSLPEKDALSQHCEPTILWSSEFGECVLVGNSWVIRFSFMFSHMPVFVVNLLCWVSKSRVGGCHLSCYYYSSYYLGEVNPSSNTLDTIVVWSVCICFVADMGAEPNTANPLLTSSVS